MPLVAAFDAEGDEIRLAPRQRMALWLFDVALPCWRCADEFWSRPIMALMGARIRRLAIWCDGYLFYCRLGHSSPR